MLDRFWCGLRGHTDVLQVDRRDGRVYLLCTSCLRETPGWRVRPPVTRSDRAQTVPVITRRAA